MASKNKRSVFVTGANGFIGANLTRKLLKQNLDVHILAQDIKRLSRLKDVLGLIRLHTGDLLDLSSLERIFKKVKPDYIIHLATYSKYQDQQAASKMIDVNIKGTFNLLLSTSHINYEAFVNTGSSSEYGIKSKSMKETDLLEPISFYAATKASATHLCQAFAREHQKPIVSLRPFSVYGPYEEEKRFIPTMVRAVLDSKPIKLTPGTQRRDFVFVEDIVNIYLKTIINGKKLSGQILNMGTGIEYSNDEVVKTLFNVTGKKVKIEKGAFPKKIWDTSHWVADITKTKRLLHWKPEFSLAEGLKKTYEWHLRRYEK